MADLKTLYLGLKLKNPLVAASCSLTGKLETLRELEAAGVGAVVLKSLFEEQMDAETREIGQYAGPEWHAEAYDYVRNMGMELGPSAYLKLLEEAKKTLSIPVIASLNCVSEQWWSDYAKKLENHGADALELNLSYLPSNPKASGLEVEAAYLRVVEKMTRLVKIPVAVKVGPYFSNLASFAQALHAHGAQALVLFNRFYQLDIDLDTMAFKAGNRLSDVAEASLPLRWIALLSRAVDCDLVAATGVQDAQGLIKMLLAGAQVVQVASAFYKQGTGYAAQMVDGLTRWMDQKGFATLDDFRGRLSRGQGGNPELLDRLQYIKALVGIE